ncbi:hypothetical protein NOCA2210144 [metagenome]|uniref:Uncharacterized protein n=1 Tax=metagenome TaxID=256318 RepID=A0A2P2BYJ1_9ZZZZ
MWLQHGLSGPGIAESEEAQGPSAPAYFLDSLGVVESADGHPERVAVLLRAALLLRSVGTNVYAYYVPEESRRSQAEHTARTALGNDCSDDSVDIPGDLHTPLTVRGVQVLCVVCRPLWTEGWATAQIAPIHHPSESMCLPPQHQPPLLSSGRPLPAAGR